MSGTFFAGAALQTPASTRALATRLDSSLASFAVASLERLPIDTIQVLLQTCQGLRALSLRGLWLHDGIAHVVKLLRAVGEETRAARARGGAPLALALVGEVALVAGEKAENLYSVCDCLRTMACTGRVARLEVDLDFRNVRLKGYRPGHELELMSTAFEQDMVQARLSTRAADQAVRLIINHP